MAWWGQAVALGPNINAPAIDTAAAKSAYDAAQRALALSSTSTPNEQAYIHAICKR